MRRQMFLYSVVILSSACTERRTSCSTAMEPQTPVVFPEFHLRGQGRPRGNIPQTPSVTAEFHPRVRCRARGYRPRTHVSLLLSALS